MANSDDSNGNIDLVIMAIDIRERGTVGCAYYVASEGTLKCMEDIVKGGSNVLDQGEIQNRELYFDFDST